MSNFDRAATALGITDTRLVSRLHAILDAFGVFSGFRDAASRFAPAVPGQVKVGDVVIAYAHQRFRAVLVWNVTPTKLSGVYLTPSNLKFPNNITTKIADCLFVTSGAVADIEPVEPAPAAPVVEPAADDDERAAAYAAQSTATCDHGRLLWQSCRPCGVEAYEPAPGAEPVLAGGAALSAGMLPVEVEGFLF